MGPAVTNMFLLPAAESVDSVPTSETKPDEGGSGSHQQSCRVILMSGIAHILTDISGPRYY